MSNRDPRYFKVYQDGDDRELEQKIQQVLESGAAPGIDTVAREGVEEIQRMIENGEIGGGGGGAGVDPVARQDIQEVSEQLAEMEGLIEEKPTIKVFNSIPSTSQLLNGEFGFVVDSMPIRDLDFSLATHLPQNFDVSVGGNTSINVNVEEKALKIEGEQAPTDAGIIVLKDHVPVNVNRRYIHKCKTVSTANYAYLFNLELVRNPPSVISSTVASGARALLRVYQRQTGGFGLYRKMASGTDQFWDEATKTWVAATNMIAYTGAINTQYQIELITTPNNVQLLVKSADGATTHTSTPVMAWSELIPNGMLTTHQLRLFWGDIYTDAHNANITTTRFTVL